MKRLSVLLFLAFLGLAASAAAQAPRTDEAAKQQAVNIARNWLQANMSTSRSRRSAPG
jgi:hypothetical protein